MDPALARRIWQLIEPCHACVYFAPEARARYDKAGLKGGWMGYFASRAAPMGAVPAAVVIATFYNFHPDMVRRAIPDAWDLATPERVTEARWAVADDALTRLLADRVGSPEVEAAASLAGEAAAAGDIVGRPLFAAHTTLDEPDDAHLALWRAATLLREHRGDGHVAALVDADVDGCEAHVVLAATGAVTPEQQREYRKWSEEEWNAAVDRLRSRGWLDADIGLTRQGREARTAIEDRTDELALGPFEALGADRAEQLDAALVPVYERIVGSGGMPFPNPVGLTPLVPG